MLQQTQRIEQTAGASAPAAAPPPPAAPWLGLGLNVQEAVDSRQAIALAGLDWQVDQWPIAVLPPSGAAPIAARSFVANVRTDTRGVLGIVTRKYQPFQNRDAFAFADAIVGEGHARYETAGALRGGRRVWMLLKLPGPLSAGMSDLIQPYLLVYNTFDGSSCLRALLTSIRVICQNSLNLALATGRGEGITVRHSGELASRVDQARQTLGLVRKRLDHFAHEIRTFRRTAMTTERLEHYFQALLPELSGDAGERERANRRKALDALHANFADPTNNLAGMRGSLWAALNAATAFADHQRRFRGQDQHARAENRLDSIWFGSGNDFKQAAYRSALELANLN